MKNEVNYYPNAKWVAINGAFTSDELRDIADKIDNPEKRKVDGDKK